jgi:hypothetical protein
VVCIDWRTAIAEVNRDAYNFRKFVRTIAGTPEQFKLWWSMGAGTFLAELSHHIDELVRKRDNGRQANT